MSTTGEGSTAAAGGDFLSVRGVDKSFHHHGGAVHALEGMHLGLHRGEFVSLLGPSGCGKSTLLRIVGGLVDADEGVVSIGGVTPRAARRSKQYGLVPQTPALVPWKTLGQNVRFLTRLGRGPEVHAPMTDHEIDELLRTVGLDGFERAYPHELSGGMQQRAALVRAFALGAPILLMDEPFAALDEITRSDMRYLLLELWGRYRSTVLFVTHSVAEAAILSDRVLVMAARPGRIVAERTIDLPRPRSSEMEDEPAFHEHVRALRASLRGRRPR